LQITTQGGKLIGYYHPKGLKFWKDWVFFLWANAAQFYVPT
jgi:hypothetical protein